MYLSAEGARSRSFNLNKEKSTKDFVDKDKIFTNHFFTDLATKIPHNNNNPLEEFEEERRRDIEPGCSDNVKRGYSDVCEIDSLDVENRFAVSLSELDFAIEQLRSVLNEIGAEVPVDDGVSSGREDKYLRNHLFIIYYLSVNSE